MFIFKTEGLTKLSNHIQKQGLMMAKVEAGMLNNTALRMRNRMVDSVASTMTIRNNRFMRSSIRFQKATQSRMVAEVGSIKRPRFTGWIEQETGKEDKERKRFATINARRRQWKKKITGRFRMKPGFKFTRPGDHRNLSNSRGRDTMIFLQILKRRKFKEPFFIPNEYKKLQKGLYFFKGGKQQLTFLQGFDPDLPERNRWMNRVVSKITKAEMKEDLRKSMKFFGVL